MIESPDHGSKFYKNDLQAARTSWRMCTRPSLPARRRVAERRSFWLRKLRAKDMRCSIPELAPGAGSAGVVHFALLVLRQTLYSGRYF